MRHVYLTLLLASCATDGGNRKNEKRDASDYLQTTYVEATDRLTSTFVEDGWIVSRHQDGSTEHEGDSLIWVGIAMASLPCAEGSMFSHRMAKMIDDQDGQLIRYEPLGEYANGREVTFDGATGLYFGIFQRLRRCKEEYALWEPVWRKHLTHLEENNWRLHKNVSATVAPQFNAIRDYITYQLGMGEEPSSWRYRVLEAEAMTWSSAVVESKQPCFRVHLAWLYMAFLDDADVMLESAYDGFCYATEKAGLPIIDHWCERVDIDKWINNFEYNVYEYAHQRCPAWETPDAGSLAVPGLDLIFAISFAYPEVLNAD